MKCAQCGRVVPDARYTHALIVNADGTRERKRTGQRDRRHPYDPFCSTRCALAYARIAYVRTLP